MPLSRSSTVLVLGASLVSACSATIARRTEPPMDGRIVRAEREAIVVETADGVEQRVEWSEVRDIDHPGNIAVLLSPLVLLGGASCAAMNSLGGGDRSTSEVYLRSGQVLAGAMLLSGLAIWIESKARASPPVHHPENSQPR